MKPSVLAALVLASASAFAQSWDFVHTASSPHPITDGAFGSQTEIDGLNAFVTAPSDTYDENENPGGVKGSVYAYAKATADAPWSFVQKLKSPASNQAFGVSLSAHGDYLVVGAPGSPTSGHKGAAYVYKKGSDGKWSLLQTLENVNSIPDDRYASIVSINGNVILVTAFGRSPSPSLSYCGAAYVYEKDAGGMWTEKQTLTASDAATGDIFGYAGAVGDNIIVLGAPGEGIEDTSGSPNRGHGAVYVFRRQAGTWVESKKIVQQVRIAFASFGEAIAVSGNSILATAKTKDIAGFLTANFYDASAEPVFKGEFVTDFSGGFTGRIDISGNRAVFSLPAEGSLKAYFFERSNAAANWAFGPKMYSPNIDKFDDSWWETFGGAIAISGTDILIGAPANDVHQGSSVIANAGVAYFYKYTTKPPAFTKTFHPEMSGDFYRPSLIDFDNDGDLDLFADHSLDQKPARLYRKEPSGYVEVREFPPASVSGTTVWLDANGDGWLDLFSRHLMEYPFTIFDNSLYINQRDGTFKERLIKFPGNDGSYGHLYFADYDVDGDQDVLMQTDTYENAYMQLFRNEGDFTFTESKITFKGSGHVQGTQPWFDFNNDGFLDFVTIGNYCDNSVHLHINNEGKNFTSHQTPASAMDGTKWGAPIWGEMLPSDFDNDGDYDFIWTGNRSCQGTPMHTGVIRNHDGNLENTPITFRKTEGWATIVAGDFSNDGITDMVTIGQRTDKPPGMDFLMGTGTGFNKLQLYEVPWDLHDQGMDVGDVDNDGDLDFFIFARAYPLAEQPMTYINNAAQGWTRKNNAPTIPGSIKVAYLGSDQVSLNWQPATDDTTPAAALTYNVSITRGESFVINSYSNFDGSRQRYIPGNAGHRTFMYLKNLKQGVYKVRVQAIDNSFTGSSFSEEFQFVIGGPSSASWADNFTPRNIDAIADGTQGKYSDLFLIGNGNNSSILFRYSNNGALLWSKEYETTAAAGVAVRTDDANDVYVTGNLQTGVFLSKYSQSGTLIWTKSIASNESSVTSMEIADNSIYLGGMFKSSDANPNHILKIDLSGNIVKEIKLAASSFVTDLKKSAESIYASGGTNVDSKMQATLARLSFGGEILWQKYALDQESNYSEASAVALDSNGDVYVVGANSRKFVSKFTKTGDLLFTIYIDGEEDLSVPPAANWGRRHWGITTVGKNFYLVGGFGGQFTLRPNLTFSDTKSEVAIIKFNEIGYPQWLRTFTGDGFNYARTIFHVGNKLLIAGTFEGAALTIDEHYTLGKDGAGNTAFVAVIEDAVVVNFCPAYSSLVAGNTNICDNESVTLSMTKTPWSHNAVWTRDDVEFSKTKSLNVVVNSVGKYLGIVNQGSVCEYKSNEIRVDLATKPTSVTSVKIHSIVKPVVTQTGNSITAPTSSAYQWYKDEVEVNAAQGGKSRSLTIAETAKYFVKVFNEFGCSNVSDTVVYVVTGLEDTMFEGMKIYPVPSRDELFIENENGDEFKLSIVDASGRECKSIAATVELHHISLTDLAPGVYLIRIEKYGGVVLKRFVKL